MALFTKRSLGTKVFYSIGPWKLPIGCFAVGIAHNVSLGVTFEAEEFPTILANKIGL